jgi:methyl-accepting chemotaxis protein
MLSFISRIPIFRRLFYAFLLAALVPGIIIVILGSTFINILNAHSIAEQESNQALIFTEQSAPDLQATYNTLLDAADFLSINMVPNAGNGSQTVIGNLQDYTNLFDLSVQTFQEEYALTTPNMSGVQQAVMSNDPNSPLPAQQQQIVNKLLKDWPAYKQQLVKVQADIQNGIAFDPTRGPLYLAFVTVSDDWQQLIENTQAISQQIVQTGPAVINPVILAIVIALLVTIALVVIIGAIINQTITSPLRELASLTRRIGRGETAARARPRGHDEITMVANSMNNMLDNIVRLIQEVQSQRDNLQAQVEKLVSEVSGVGEGDLRIQAEVTADALGVLADSFNYMVEELGSLVVRVKGVASEVEHSTEAILDRMNQLVESGDMEIRQIEEAAQEVERMAASSRQVAERTQALYDVAREARRSAQVGRLAVQQAISGMSRIDENVKLTATRVQSLNERSREIEEIVNVIGTIAHQTNRLALDAAIQAAMAGENGKGFGAVAADIRRLAERAKEQTSSITQIVRNVREEIQAVGIAMQDTERETASGTDLAKEVSVSLESLFSAVESQARAIETINTLATQQLQSSSAVVQVMHSVSEATGQANLSTREASQNMERLARLVEQLRASVEAFKLREDQNYYSLNPNSVNVSLETEPESPMSTSGIFRTISASVQHSTSGPLVQGALPAPRSDSFMPYMPMSPASPMTSAPYGNQQNNGTYGWNGNGNNGAYAGSGFADNAYSTNNWGNMPLPPDQSWFGEQYNNGNENGNGNGGWQR